MSLRTRNNSTGFRIFPNNLNLSVSYTQQPGQFPGQPPAASQAPPIASGAQSSASSTSLSNSAIVAQQPPAAAAAFPPMSYSNPTVPAQPSVVTSTPEKNQVFECLRKRKSILFSFISHSFHGRTVGIVVSVLYRNFFAFIRNG